MENIDFQHLMEASRGKRDNAFMQAMLPYCASARAWLAADVDSYSAKHQLSVMDIARINKNVAKVQTGFVAWCIRARECNGDGTWENKATAAPCMASSGLFFAQWATGCLRGGCSG